MVGIRDTGDWEDHVFPHATHFDWSDNIYTFLVQSCPFFFPFFLVAKEKQNDMRGRIKLSLEVQSLPKCSNPS